MYADETGNLDYNGVPNTANGGGASTYFGFGTATFPADHGVHLMEALKLRARLEADGVRLPKGFHAYNDSSRIRSQVFNLIQTQAPRFDATFLCKQNAYPNVRQRGEMYLYKMAWYQHFKEIALQVSSPSDHLYVIAGEFGTAQRSTQAQAALHDVCQQVQRTITLCVWKSVSSWGLQAADYGLWACQRTLEGKICMWFPSSVQPTLQSFYLPWGRV
ncbi:Protein of uncharacterised function (DUF3800) [Mycobacteroides abscessus subsp. abscessus]|nr:Protein of uncharacterised function (DUF3800) [Mycobacteroides abscessus subsp. abscessus]